MKYRIVGTTVPAVELKLNRGESMYTQSGGLAWQSNGIRMETNVKGGLMKGLGRMFSGESLFMATYTAETDDALIAFASTVPGAVIPVDTDNTSFIIQKGAFLAAESSVHLETVFTKKFEQVFSAARALLCRESTAAECAFLK